jgi:hypothetical protein
MLDRSLALRFDVQVRKQGGPRKTYIFQCSQSGCRQEVRVRADALRKASGKCSTHTHVKRPFESIYNGIFNDHRKTEVIFTYEEFLTFTKITECHYCGEPIPWAPYGVVRGKFLSRAYFLDRKNHAQGYSVDNCIVCCTQCNRMRSDKFTYEEFMELSPVLRKVKAARKD